MIGLDRVVEFNKLEATVVALYQMTFHVQTYDYKTCNQIVTRVQIIVSPLQSIALCFKCERSEALGSVSERAKIA